VALNTEDTEFCHFEVNECAVCYMANGTTYTICILSHIHNTALRAHYSAELTCIAFSLLCLD